MVTPIAIIINTTKGQQMDTSFRWASIDIIKEVNRIPTAEITLIDTSQGVEKFPIGNSGFFDPGQSIEIKLRYANSKEAEKTAFKGIVLRHHIKGSAKKGSLLTLELKDVAFKLTKVRKSKVYLNKTDTDIISGIIKETGGIEGPKIASGIQLYKHKELPRYYCTDWDFILSRADINGLLTVVDDGKMSIMKMPDFTQPKHTFELGISPVIFDFEMETNIKQQYNMVQAIAWDSKEQGLTTPKEAKKFTLKQAKNLKTESINKAVGGMNYELKQFGEAPEEEMQAWANAKMAKSRMAMVKGRINTAGNVDYKIGDTIKIARVSDMFDENTMISGIRHTLNAEIGWQTHVQFGLSPCWFSKNEDIADTPASGLLPPVNGLQIAIVDKFESDPEYRIKVRVPMLGDEPIWARLAGADAGSERGTFFRPEQGDEVILGFFNDDPRQPVILGSLYSSGKHKIPSVFTIDKKNETKGLVTKNGVKLHINDEKDKCTVLIETPEKNSVVLKDGEGITFKDQNENTILMSSKGITINDQNKNTILMSSKGIHLKTGKKLTIKATNITVK